MVSSGALSFQIKFTQFFLGIFCFSYISFGAGKVQTEENLCGQKLWTENVPVCPRVIVLVSFFIILPEGYSNTKRNCGIFR